MEVQQAYAHPGPCLSDSVDFVFAYLDCLCHLFSIPMGHIDQVLAYSRIGLLSRVS